MVREFGMEFLEAEAERQLLESDPIIDAVVSTMTRAINRANEQREAVKADPRYTAQYRRTLLERIEDEVRDAVYSAFQRLWGDPTSGQLEGGLCWQKMGQAEAILRTAKQDAHEQDDADDLARLDLQYRRFDSRLAGFDTLTDFEKWYDQASRLEKLAACDVGVGKIQAKFKGNVHVGAVVEMLRRDADALRETPALVRAQQRADAVLNAVARAHEASEAASRALGETTFNDFTRRVLAMMIVRTTYPDPSDPSAPAFFEIQKAAPSISIDEGKQTITVGG